MLCTVRWGNIENCWNRLTNKSERRRDDLQALQMARLSAQLNTTRLPMPRSVIVGVVAIIVVAAVISANVRYRLELEPPAQSPTDLQSVRTSATGITRSSTEPAYR